MSAPVSRIILPGTPDMPRKAPGIIGYHSAPSAHGHITTQDWDGRTIEIDTRQCCHCGGHFPVTPGSGRKRGYCLKCNDVTCGRAHCDECRSYKKFKEEGHY